MGGWLAFTPAGEELFRRCEPCKATGRKATAA
jgi:hypothetical protein